MRESTGTPAPDRLYLPSTVLVMSLGHLLAFVDRAKVAGVLPAIRAQIPMTDTAAAAVIGTAFATAYVVTLLLLTIAERGRERGWRWRLLAGVVIWGIATAVTGLADTLPELLGARALLGVGQALFIPAALTSVVTASPSRAARAANLAIFTAAASFGRSAGLLVIGGALALVQWLSLSSTDQAWRWSFIATVVPNLLLLGLLRTPLVSFVQAPAAAETGLRVAWRAQAMFMLLALMPIMLIQATVGWLPTLLVSEYAVTVQQASYWAGAIVLVAGPTGQLIGGWLLRRLKPPSRAVPWIIASAMTVGLPGFIPVASGSGMRLAAIGMSWAYFALGIAGLAALYGWQDLMPQRVRLAGNGLYLALVTAVAIGLGPLLTGLIADQAAALPVALLKTALVCTSVALLIAVLRRTRLATPRGQSRSVAND